MALVTRCPKCSTMFRVVPDQLRVSAGWVRCGHCQEVFDAAQHMLPRGSELAVLGDARESVREGYDMRDAQDARATHDAHDGYTARKAQEAHDAQGAQEAQNAPDAQSVQNAHEGEDALTNSASLLQRREGTQQSTGLPTPESDAVNEALPPHSMPQPLQSAQRRAPGAPDTAFMAELGAARAAVVVGTPAAPPPVPAAVQSGGAGREPPPHGPVDLLLSELGEEIDESAMAPSFVQRARRRRQPSSPHMRALFWFGLAALTLTLVLQMLISERNWLAARQPALAPALRGLCGLFNCHVGPYQHIDAIVIDNSGFSRAADGSFQFHYTLRNQANLPVATPALELTLTDMQERALVRRVISVHELGAPASIAARGEFSGARTIILSSTANPAAVTGYKLVAFYP